MNFYKFLSIHTGILFSCAFSISLFACSPEKKTKSPPNILILLADDMGYGDLGCYGGIANTPNIDALAASGIRFTDCYAGAPNCSPSRVSLMTGRIPARSGMYSYRPPNHVMHLPDEELTIAELLKPQGFQTAHIGKWHLGCLPQDSSLNHPQPNQQGFDYSLGTENNAQPSHLNPVNFVRNGEKIGETEGYSSQLLANEVESWFDTHYQEEKPFFLYVPFHEPHAKIASPPDLVAKYAEHDQKSAEYFANIENLDIAVGRILRLLEEKGLRENTMIFFASDNGSYRFGSNANLRGKKGEVYEGGVRVPGIFSFAGRFRQGETEDTPIWFQDVLPTLCGLLEIPPPKEKTLDGINLLPLLTKGEMVSRLKPMLWFFYRSAPELAARQGDYNLIGYVQDSMPRTHWLADIDMPFIKEFRPDHFEMYQLRNDPGQQVDLFTEEPQQFQDLREDVERLFLDVQGEGPVWEGLPAYDPERAGHNKPAEFVRNQERFLK